MTATFNSSASFRTVENPAGSASLRSTRFPYVSFGGPARGTPFAVGVSYSTYTNRDFSNATVDTLELRDMLIPVFDTLSSRGGMSDLRIAGSFKARERSVIGGSFHILTGSNRMAGAPNLHGQSVPAREAEHGAVVRRRRRVPRCRSPARPVALGRRHRAERRRRLGGAGFRPGGRHRSAVLAGTRPALEDRRQARPGGARDLSNLVRREQRPPGPGRERRRTTPSSWRSAANS